MAQPVFTATMLRLQCSTLEGGQKYRMAQKEPGTVKPRIVPSWRITELNPYNYVEWSRTTPSEYTEVVITEVYTDDGRCLWAYHTPQEIAEAMGMDWRDLTRGCDDAR